MKESEKRMKDAKCNQFSEEVQDIVDRMPTRWCLWVAGVVFLIVTLMITAGFVIKYPDTVSGAIVVRREESSVRLMSASTGRIHLLRANHSQVAAGEVIAYIENGATYRDFHRMERICQTPLEQVLQENVPDRLTVGELSTAYNNFVLAYRDYVQLCHTGQYAAMRQSLQSQIHSDSEVMEMLHRQQKIYSEMTAYNQHVLENDSLLHAAGALSGEQTEEQRQVLRQARMSQLELNNSQLQRASEIGKNRIELARVDMDEQEKRATSYHTLQQTFNELSNAVRVWKERYLITAPVFGYLEYLGFWEQNMYVVSSRELFSISPRRKGCYGEMQIAVVGAGKVEPKQAVNVKLYNFPYDEFGFVRGEVKSISRMAGQSETGEGQVLTYRVVVGFPDGIRTNYGKTLPLGDEATGQADIIVKKRRLIQRLFDNLKSKENK